MKGIPLAAVMLVSLTALASAANIVSKSGTCANCTPIRVAQATFQCCQSCAGNRVCTTCRAGEFCVCGGGNNVVACHPASHKR